MNLSSDSASDFPIPPTPTTEPYLSVTTAPVVSSSEKQEINNDGDIIDLLEDPNTQRSIGGSRVRTSLGQYLADTDVDSTNTVQITLAEAKSLLSPYFINHQTLNNILKVVKVTGAQNAKNITKVFKIAVKMVEIYRSIRAIFMST